MNTKIFLLSKKMYLLVLMTIITICSINAEEVILKSGTQIPLALQGTINCKNVSNGSIINFKCQKDIKVNNSVVIRAGEMAKGQVTRIKKNGIFGREGEIEIKVTSITAIDGTEVYLSSSSLYDEGKNKLVVSLLFCWFIKGGKAEIPAETQCIASVASNTNITIK